MNSQTANFRFFLTEIAVDYFKFDNSGRKISKLIENTVGKEKLLIMSNFSFSYSVYERRVLLWHKRTGPCMGKV